MARRSCYLHIDLAGLTGNHLAHELVDHRDALHEQGFKVPVHRVLEGDLATIELRRNHTQHGLKRRHVEGSWAELCRRIWRGTRIPLISLPALGKASAEQVELALDGLAGLRLHVLISVPAVADPQTQARAREAVDLWRSRLKNGRVLTQPVHGRDDWTPVTAAFADLAGVEVEALTHTRVRPVPA